MELAELLESIDAVEYISQFVELEEKGGEFWGLSPFQNENTPSFSVRRESGKFFDFSSGLGGNLLTFVKNYFRCSGREAIQKLQEYAGVDGVIKPRRKIAVVESAKKFAIHKKPAKESKYKALPDDYMTRYEKNKSKMEVWRSEGISDESMERFQVYYDSFSDRLVYPVRDAVGNIVNVCGRALDPEWKTKGMRKYTYFMPWGEMKTIYGFAENMSEIKKNGEIILFEGCKSVLLADSWGIKNTGAILTSHLNPNQMKLLAKLGCNVVFALDKEINIKEDYNIQRLKRYVNVYYVWDRENLLDDKDSPVDKGEDVWRRLYEQRMRWR